MKALLIPFGYPGYPGDVVLDRIEEAKLFLSELNIDFDFTQNIIVFSDCEQAIQKIKTTDFDYAIVLIVTWVETPNIISIVSQMKCKPMLLWSHENIYNNESKEVVTLGAIASAGVLRETFEELGYQFKFVVGNSFDGAISKDILSFHRAAGAIARMQQSRLGLVGYVSMGMHTGLVDHMKVKRFFGTEIIHIDQYTVLSRLNQVNPEETAAIINSLKDKWNIDKNVGDELLWKTAAIYLSLKNIVNENKLSSMTVKCQYEMSVEFGFSPCVSLSLLGEELPVSCEGDVPLLLSQMILNEITGKVVTYGDVLEFLDNGIICAACGYAPRSFLKPEKPRIAKHTAICSGLLIMSPFKEEKVTVIRLANDKDGFKIHLIKGSTEELKDFHEIGCPQYAGSVIRFENKSVRDFIQEIMSQHYAIVFGDYEMEIKDFCSLMKIRIV